MDARVQSDWKGQGSPGPRPVLVPLQLVLDKSQVVDGTDLSVRPLTCAVLNRSIPELLSGAGTQTLCFTPMPSEGHGGLKGSAFTRAKQAMTSAALGRALAPLKEAMRRGLLLQTPEGETIRGYPFALVSPCDLMELGDFLSLRVSFQGKHHTSLHSPPVIPSFNFLEIED